jgi:hypothetical protein
MDPKILSSSKINPTKLLGGSSFANNTNNISEKLKEDSITISKSDLSIIKGQVFEIKNLVTNLTTLKKKRLKTERKETERERFDKREKELEKKKKPEDNKIKLPQAPKLGFLDIIRRFVVNTLIGFIAIRLIKHLPKMIEVVKFLGGAMDFITNVGGNLLNGLATFVQKGYEAYDFTRKTLKTFGGDNAVKLFDGFNNALGGIVTAALAASFALFDMAGGDSSGSDNVRIKGRTPGRSRRGIDPKLARRYTERFGRDAAARKFGQEGVRSLGGKYARSGATNLARNALVGVAGKSGAKKALKVVAPLVRNVPLIGGIMEFVLSWMSGDPIGKAAFKGVGAGLGTWIGGALGSLIPIPGVGTAIGMWIGSAGGSKLAEVIYDKIFNNQDPNQKNQKVAKAAGGGQAPATRGGKIVSGPRRSITKSKVKRQIAIQPTQLKPGADVGGEEKIEKVFPKSKDKNQVSPLDYIEKSYKNTNQDKSFGSLLNLQTKSLVGQKPSKIDYKNAAQGLSNWMTMTFSDEILRTGAVYAAGGGEINADMLSKKSGDMTDAIARSLEDSISKRLDANIDDLMKQMMLKEPEIKGKPGQQPEGGGEEGGGGDLETAGGAVSASELYKEIGANLDQWDIFRNSVALIESGGRYSAMGGSGKHYDGRYQMGEAAKKDGSKVAGVSYPGHSSDPNAHVRVSFRNNPQLQETIFTGYTLANHRYLMRNPKYKSASVERKLQILGYAHNQGMGGAEGWLNTGVVGADGFGTKGTKYTDLIAKNFRAKKSGGAMELAKGAVSIPSEISGRVGSFGVMDPTPTSRPGVRGSTGYAADSGLDIIGKTGDSVVSPVDGTLLYAEEGHTSWKDDSNPDKPGHQPQHSFLIQLSKSFKYGGKTIKYAYGTHLSSLGSSFANKSGVPIKSGQFIGRMGVANKVPHLHLGLLQNRAQSSPSDWLSNVEVKNVLTGSRFHGGFVPKDGLYNLHKGEFVVDKDSVDLVGKNFIATINAIENKTQLQQKVGSLIDYLSYITGYEPGGQQQVVVEMPEEKFTTVPIAIPIGGRGMMIAGSEHDSDRDGLYAQG